MFQVQISGSSFRFIFQVLDFGFYVVGCYCRFQISGLSYRVRISGFAFHLFDLMCQISILGFHVLQFGFRSQVLDSGVILQVFYFKFQTSSLYIYIYIYFSGLDFRFQTSGFRFQVLYFTFWFQALVFRFQLSTSASDVGF